MSQEVLAKQIDLLTIEQQQEVLDFVHFLISKNQGFISDFAEVPGFSNASVKRISDESSEKKQLLRTLVGIIPQDADENLLREERLARQ